MFRYLILFIQKFHGFFFSVEFSYSKHQCRYLEILIRDEYYNVRHCWRKCHVHQNKGCSYNWSLLFKSSMDYLLSVLNILVKTSPFFRGFCETFNITWFNITCFKLKGFFKTPNNIFWHVFFFCDLKSDFKLQISCLNKQPHNEILLAQLFYLLL